MNSLNEKNDEFKKGAFSQQQPMWFDVIFFSDILKFPFFYVYLIFCFFLYDHLRKKKEVKRKKTMKKNDNDGDHNDDDVFQVSWTRIWMKHTNTQKGENTKNFCEFHTLKTTEECWCYWMKRIQGHAYICHFVLCGCDVNVDDRDDGVLVFAQ